MKVSTIQIYQLEEKRAILHSIQAYHVYVSINISKNFNIFSTAYYLNILITFRRSAKNTSGIRIYIYTHIDVFKHYLCINFLHNMGSTRTHTGSYDSYFRQNSFTYNMTHKYFNNNSTHKVHTTRGLWLNYI